MRGPVNRERMPAPETPRIPSFELRLISTITWPSAISLQQAAGVVLVHHVHAVANALGVASFTASRMWKRSPSGGTRPRPARPHAAKCAPRINGVQIPHHLHLQRVIAHRDEAVFGLHEVDAHKAALMRLHALLHGLESQQRLRKDLIRRGSRAGSGRCSGSQPGMPSRLCGAAVLQAAPLDFRLAYIRRGPRRPRRSIRGPEAAGGNARRPRSACSSSAFQPISWAICRAWLKAGVTISSRYCSFCAAARRRNFVYPFAGMVLDAAEADKGGKELVVPAPARGGHKAAHRKRVNHLVVERLTGGAHVTGSSGRDQLVARKAAWPRSALPCRCIDRPQPRRG